MNEGTADLSVIAKTARELPSVPTSKINVPQDSFIWSTGLLSSHEMIGDSLFLTPGNYIAINRVVEMYAWQEQKESKTQKNLGGSATTETTYTYEKRWLTKPFISNNFKYPEEHKNPPPSLSDVTIRAHKVFLGTYKINMTAVTLPHGNPLRLNPQNMTVPQEAHLANDHYVFVSKTGTSTFEDPQVGDMRICYEVLPSGTTGTIFGKLKGDAIIPYVDVTNQEFYRIFSGTRDQAITTLHSEYNISIWILRGAGFLMMWLGLWLLLNPVSVFLDIVPLFGSVSEAIMLLLTLLIALPLTALIILVSMLLHSVIALIIALVITLTLIIIGLKKMSKKTPTQ